MGSSDRRPAAAFSNSALRHARPWRFRRSGRGLFGGDVRPRRTRLADALAIAKFAFCGLSLGGAIGQWVAAHASHRITHLVLANTSPQFGPAANWETRIKIVREAGMAGVVELAMQRFFSSETAAKNPHAGSIRSLLLGTDPVGYVGCCAALRDADLVSLLPRIQSPTLVIVGDRDVSTPWGGHGERLAHEIPNAKTLHLAAAHLSNLEQPRSFSSALLEFLLQPEKDAVSLGCRIRDSPQCAGGLRMSIKRSQLPQTSRGNFKI